MNWLGGDLGVEKRSKENEELMKVTKWLKTSLLIATICGGAMACTTRDCTEEERAEVDAEDDESCVRVLRSKPFTDDSAQKKSVDWEPGDDLVIQGDVREIEIIEGGTEEVEVSYRAQVDLAEDRSDEVVAETWSDLTNSLKRDGSRIVVSASNGSSKANLGAKIQVKLPFDFDGNVGIDIGRDLPGDLIDIDFLGKAKTLKVDVDSPKDLKITNVSRLTRADIHVHGDVRLGSFSSADLRDVTILSEIGDVEVYFSRVPSDGATVTTEFGDLEISLPDTGNYTMQVQADDGVTMSGVPQSCQADEEGRKDARALTCNEGADDITFQLVVDGEATIDFL